MRFLDATVFIYAYYRPRKELTEKEAQIKHYAKGIVSEVSQGKEEVMMTVVHLSEIVDLLKHGMPLERLTNLILGLFMLDNVKMRGVSKEAYFAAAELGADLKLEANDALAVDVMRQSDIKEIYSFDESFDHVDGILRLPKL